MSKRGINDRVERLVESKAQFLRFLERRLGNRGDAEDLLQAALLKVLAQHAPLRDEDKLVPWFYQILRNLLIDHRRRAAGSQRMMDQVAADADALSEMDDELFRAVCECVNGVVAALKPQYRVLIRRVELADEPLNQVGQDLGITPNNAAVRLHRARRALREGLVETCGACTEHGCLDCTCRTGPPDTPLTTTPPEV